MFYAIPLENRPTWRNPPWMTVLLILLNMAVFWGPQRAEEKAQDKAVAFYLTSKLPALEIPPFVAWLEAHDAPRAKIAKALQRRGADAHLLDGMERERDFMAQLKSDRVITPAQPQYAEWKAERARYEALQPAPFTQRWAQDHARMPSSGR